MARQGAELRGAELRGAELRGAEPGPAEGAAPAPGPASVRVLGTRLDRYVEFAFSLGDADLTVELVMPFDAFAEFCATHRCAVLPPEPAADAALARLAWRAGHPGLYRRPETEEQE
ncbi:MAG TPA: phenol hydroxylase subunit [Dongiaceae bacterium]|nr:phenol hydroxylase subunit [Dongiaceae bacterium]